MLVSGIGGVVFKCVFSCDLAAYIAYIGGSSATPAANPP
jgi:hypothetical protein